MTELEYSYFRWMWNIYENLNTLRNNHNTTNDSNNFKPIKIRLVT